MTDWEREQRRILRGGLLKFLFWTAIVTTLFFTAKAQGESQVAWFLAGFGVAMILSATLKSPPL